MREHGFLRKAALMNAQMKMPGTQVLLALMLLTSTLAWADPAAEALQWYESEFAPLWASSTTANPAKIRTFFVEGYREHPRSGGSVVRPNSVDEWTQRIRGYMDKGWREGKLLRIAVKAINERTVYIRTSWINTNADKSQFPTCDYYLASKYPEGWKLTNYFYVKCPDRW
jgi:hypothetical protein